MSVKALLEQHASERNRINELSYQRPDPLLIARRHPDEYSALICALFGYGSAKAIVAFLERLDFRLLDADEATIRTALTDHYYRFQTAEDIVALFIALSRLKKEASLNSLFLEGYTQNGSVLQGIETLITTIRAYNRYDSRGYTFLLGNTNSSSPYKRWNMYLRWMVRRDALDLGLWQGVKRADLLIPLDTHTFKVARKLGLLQRKTYDIKAVTELTNHLKTFDADDPVKYDFALYRMGQEGLV